MGTCGCCRVSLDVGFLLGTQVFPGGRVLTLASARASDSGSYSCVAVSAVGEDRRDVVLYVHSESQARDAAWARPGAQEGGAGGVPPQTTSKAGWRRGRAGLRPWLPSWGRQLEVSCSPIADREAGEWPAQPGARVQGTGGRNTTWQGEPRAESGIGCSHGPRSKG